LKTNNLKKKYVFMGGLNFKITTANYIHYFG